MRAAREQRKAPQSALAELSGISIDTIRKLERNGILSPSFFTVARLARGLGVTLDTLAAEALDDAGENIAPRDHTRARKLG